MPNVNVGSSVIPEEDLRPTDKNLVWTPAEPNVMQMLNAAVESGKSIEYLKELISLKAILDEQALAAEQRAGEKAYDAAVVAAKKQLPTSISKGGTASFDGKSGGAVAYTYVTLDDILEQVVPILAANGLRHRFAVSQTEAQVSVACIMRHEAGHWEQVDMNGPYDRSGSKNAIQALGSTTTYLKKYTFLALLGIAAGEDDDGKLALAAKAPRAGPDRIGAGAEHPNAPPPEQKPTPALSPEEATRLKEAAMANANQGEDVFRSFYVPLNQAQRDVLTPLALELRNLMNAADAARARAPR